MFYSSINNKNDIMILPEKVRKCIDFVQKKKISAYENGVYKIDDDILVEITSFTTDYKENKRWESHKEYYDLYLILQGQEVVFLDFVKDMKMGKYSQNEDLLHLKPASRLLCRGKANITMAEGDFLFCSPDDAHMDEITLDEPAFVKKALFKIKI